MKRLIALLVATVFGVSLFCPPLAAMDRDPYKPLPWMDPSTVQDGDGGAWNEADSEGGDGIVVIFDLFKSFSGKYFIVYFIPKKIDNCGTIGRNVPEDCTVPAASRSASSR